jgi:hypothetical protein
MNTCNTAVQVHGVLRCAKIQYCTHTHVTHFGNTVGLPVPALKPTDQLQADLGAHQGRGMDWQQEEKKYSSSPQ